MATIEFKSTDDCFTRARKMCEYAGFNPREGSTPLIGYFAEILMKYMELDKITQNVPNSK